MCKSSSWSTLYSSNAARNRVCWTAVQRSHYRRSWCAKMQFICDAPGRKAWFRIETEGEATLESEAMKIRIDTQFRNERERATQSYRPHSRLQPIERDIGLNAHLLRAMPIFLTLRDGEGAALANAVLPPEGKSPGIDHSVLVGPCYTDPSESQSEAIKALEQHYKLSVRPRMIEQQDDYLFWPR